MHVAHFVFFFSFHTTETVYINNIQKIDQRDSDPLRIQPNINYY